MRVRMYGTLDETTVGVGTRLENSGGNAEVVWYFESGRRLRVEGTARELRHFARFINEGLRKQKKAGEANIEKAAQVKG